MTGKGSAVRTFGDLATGRDNNLDLLRMAAATSVVFSHSYALTGRTLAEQRHDCDHAYDRATTDAEIDAIHARCDALHEGVRHGR